MKAPRGRNGRAAGKPCQGARFLRHDGAAGKCPSVAERPSTPETTVGAAPEDEARASADLLAALYLGDGI